MMKNRVSIKRLAALVLALLMVLQTAPVMATGGDLEEYSSVTSQTVDGAEYAEVVF